jgi:hypothetical protein
MNVNNEILYIIFLYLNYVRYKYINTQILPLVNYYLTSS